jgi:multidrug resistance efflux pump
MNPEKVSSHVVVSRRAYQMGDILGRRFHGWHPINDFVLNVRKTRFFPCNGLRNGIRVSAAGRFLPEPRHPFSRTPQRMFQRRYFMKTFLNLGACFILLGFLSMAVAAQEAVPHIYVTVGSANSVVIRSELEGNNPVVMSLPEGTEVEEGDLIVQFDDTQWRRRVESQQAVLQMKIPETAQVESTLRARREIAEHELKVAEQAFVVARLKLESFQADGGEFALALLKAEAEVMIASERLELTSENSELARAQHEAALCDLSEVNAARLAVMESEAMLTVAKASLVHLQEHVRPLHEAELLLELYKSEGSVSGAKIHLESIAEELEATEAAVETAVQLEEAKLKELQDQLEKCCIYAPMSGVVSRRLYYEDNPTFIADEQRAYYREGMSLMKISDSSRLQVRFRIASNLLALGQKVRVKIDALPDQEFVGIVAEIVPDLEISLDLSFFKINIEDPEGKLMIGLTGTVEIDIVAEE